jgi:hypothetical protein
LPAWSRTHFKLSYATTRIRRPLQALLSASIVASLLALLPGPAAAADLTSASALATAIASNAGQVAGASFVSKPPNGTPDLVSSSALATFPTDGGTYAILTTGDATKAGNAPQSNFASADDLGGHRPGENTNLPTDYDVTILKIDLAVPDGSNCLSFDFRFLSEEFPQFVGSQYNDGFIAELDNNTWSTNGSSITAPDNFAFDPDHHVISINSTGVARMTAGEAAGTIYNGASTGLIAQTPVTTGNHSLYLSIFDQGDHVYDSAVFVDNLTLGFENEGQCQKGVQPLANLGVTVAPTSAPAGFAEVAKSALDYSALAAPGSAGATALSTAPITHGPITHGPITHGPVGPGPITHGPIIGQDTTFRLAPLSLLPLSHVPPILISSVPIASPPGPWTAALPPSLAALPFQTVTLQQFAPTPAAAAVHVGDLDLSSTVLGGLSPASLLFGNVTLGDLGLTAPPGYSGANALADLELGGQSLASLNIPGITLADKKNVLANALLGSISLDQVGWASAPAWNLNISDISLAERGQIVDCAYVNCANPGTTTVADAASTGDVNHTATLEDLLGLSNASTLLAGKTFGQLLPGIINIENFPLENAPLGNILAASPLDPSRFVTYTAGADIACPVGGSTMSLTLPGHGFRYAPGTASFGAGAPGSAGEPAVSGNNLTWTVPSDSCSTGTERISLSFKAEPGADLGTFTTSLHVTTPAASIAALDQAPLTTTENFESNDTPQTAQAVVGGNFYTDTISSSSDIDYFKLPVAMKDVGTMVRISLSHLPGVDYDVVLYGAAAAATLRGAPITHGPITHGPITHGPVGDDGQCLPPGVVLDPQTLQDVPVLNSATYSVRGYSTNRSTQNEFACVIVQPADVATGILIQVSSYLGASSPQPALLSVDESLPVTPLSCIDIPSTPGAAGPDLPAAGSLSTDTQTLFLVSAEAIGRFYGATGEANVLGALTDPTFLGMPNVKGVVLSVDRAGPVADAYNAWYGDYCSPDKANAVVHAINNLVDTYRTTGPGLPNLRNIVLVGSDSVLPFGRIQELVSLGSENTEAANVQFDNHDNPTSRSLLFGYMLSDDPYYSFQPMPWLSTDLYPPSVAGGRLVETTGDIVNAIAKYKAFGGVLDPKTEFTTGYDFFTDTAVGQDNQLKTNYAYPKSGPNTYVSQIDEAWDKSNVANAVNAQPGIAVLNAHADNYRLLPAAAFHSSSPSPTDLYTTDDLVKSSLADGTLMFTIGCHVGLSVPDVWVTGPTPVSLDWAQALAQKNSVLVGNTGFGYGDSKTIAFSEKLAVLFTKSLGPSMSIGQSVAYAKQQYYSGLGAWGVFDAKSVEEFTPYGLPMYVIGAGGQVAGPTPPSSPPPVQPDPDGSGLQTGSLSFASLNGGPVDTGNGVYYKGPTGATLNEQYRAIEPITDPQDVTQTDPNLRLHGALMLSFTKTDIPSFAAAISLPTLAPAADQPQPKVRDATFPSSLVSSLSQDTVFGRRDTVVVVGGQFISDPLAPPNTGTQRLLSNASVRLYYAPGDDFSVAQFTGIGAVDLGTTALVQMTTSAGDVAVAYVTYRLAGPNQFVSQKMILDQNDHTWKASIDTSQHKVAEYFVQMVTTAGNVSVSDDKVLAFPSPAPPPPGPDAGNVTVKDSAGNTVTPNEFGWYNKNPLFVTITSGNGQPVVAQLDGGSFQPVDANNPVKVDGDGMHTIVYQVGNGPDQKFEPRIDSTKPTLSSCPTPSTFLLNANGGSVPLGPLTATDPGFDQGNASGVNPNASTLQATLNTTVVGPVTFTFSAQDFAGNATTKPCTYSVQYVFSGFFTPIDNPNIVNKAIAGQTIPVKWRLTDANGAPVSDPTSFVSLTTSVGGSCGGPSDPVESYSGDSGLQYLGNGNWQFNWKTPKSYSGQCRTMTLNLKDGVAPQGGQLRTAYFQFK